MKPSLQTVERLKKIKESGIRRFFTLGQKNPSTINLSLGEPDFAPPEHALDANCEAAREEKTHYTPTKGVAELLESLARKAYQDYSLRYDPASEILVTVGGTEAIFVSLLAMVNEGDEILIPDPGFVVYEPSVLIAGGVPIHIPLNEKNSFKPSIKDVISLITNKSRVIILNSPNNPTGAVLSFKELAALAKIAVEFDLIVISDEVYEKIIYDNAKHYCFAAFRGMRERTLVINSFSKTYAMTGLRIGYVYGSKELISRISLVHQYAVACVNSLAQFIALAALDDSRDFVSNMVKEFDRRRHLVYGRLNEIGSIRCTLPKGAFYVFPNIKDFGMCSEKFVEFLANEANVISVPGPAFGSYGEGYIRISYAAAYEQLVDALGRIERAIAHIE